MGITTTIDGPMSDDDCWNALDWHKAVRIVNRIQARIVKALKAGAKRLVRGLQRLLRRSISAKLLAIRRVISNRGKNTPGVDGVKLNTPASRWQAAQQLDSKDYRPLPLKRCHIPKKNSKKLRPLSIPVMYDRAEQALELMALNPIAECRADNHSYGFRKRRSIHDAIDACYNALRRKGSANYILEGDIRGCFDHISHQWMVDNIPTHKKKLKLWLKAGYMEKGMYYPTTEGTPQGGVISPTAANMVLDNLQNILETEFRRADKVHLIRYCDDFIITGNSRELLEERVKPIVIEFLKERGLELSEEKTQISDIGSGFDFLGFHIRKYKGKLLIKPAKSNIAHIKEKIRKIVKSHKTAKTETLINLLNPVIRGWANNYRHVVSSRAFCYLDHSIWQMTWKWAKRRHPNKSLGWIKSKYYQRIGTRNWVFKERNGKEELFLMSSIRIQRHVKIKAEANPYDPMWKEYFEQRAMNEWKRKLSMKKGKLWVKQQGICPICRIPLEDDEEWHIHHAIPRHEGGSDHIDNLRLVHAICHRQVHSQTSVKNSLLGASLCLIKA